MRANRPRRRVATAFAFLCSATSVFAQSSASAPATPAAAVEQFWGAVWARDARRAASLITPEGLAAFRRQQLLTLASFAEHEARHSARDPLADRSQSGGIGAVSFDQIPERLTEAQRQLPVRGIAGIERLGQLETLAPRELLERLMNRWTGVLRPGDPIEDSDKPPAVLGSVADGDSVAHVVYRSLHSLNAESATRRRRFSVAEAQLMTVRRSRDGWRVEPDFLVFSWLAPPWSPSFGESPSKD